MLGGTVTHAQDVSLGRPVVRAARPEAAYSGTPIPTGTTQTVLLDPTTVPEAYPLKSSRLIVVQRSPAPAPITPPPMSGTKYMPRTGIRPVSADVGVQPVPMPAPAPAAPMPKTADTFAPTPKLMPSGPEQSLNVAPAPMPSGPGHVVYENGASPIWHGSAGDCGCDWGCGCAPTPRLWGSVEYLLWFTKSANTPALLTTSPPGTPFATAGRLSTPGTRILEGNDGLDVGGASGIRATIGGWFAETQDLFGWEASGFVLEKRSDITHYTSGGSQILARPYFDAIAGIEGALVIAHPAPNALIAGPYVGSYSQTLSQHIWGAEGNLIANIGDLAYSRNYLLFGFRYFDFHEKLTMASTSYAPAINFGTQVVDVFNDRTQFYGGQFGLRKTFDVTQRLSVDVTGKCALGVASQTAGAAGYTQGFNANGAFLQSAGGLYAVRTNSGRFERDRFAVLPEADLKVHYRVNQNMTVFVGGNFLYVSSVVRPGEQIDRRIDLRNVPVASPILRATPGATAQPAPRIAESDFWVTGLTAGLTIQY
jgi:hypothetical protein